MPTRLARVRDCRSCDIQFSGMFTVLSVSAVAIVAAGEEIPLLEWNPCAGDHEAVWDSASSFFFSGQSIVRARHASEHGEDEGGLRRVAWLADLPQMCGVGRSRPALTVVLRSFEVPLSFINDPDGDSSNLR